MIKRVPISTLPLTHSHLIKNSPDKTRKFGSSFPPSPRYLQNALKTPPTLNLNLHTSSPPPNKRMHTPRSMGTIFRVNPFQPDSIDPIRGCTEMTSSKKVKFLTSAPHVRYSYIIFRSPPSTPSRRHLSSKNKGLKNYGSFFSIFLSSQNFP